MNLNQANIEEAAHWKTEYRFTEDFYAKDLSVESMENVTRSLTNNANLLQKFALYNSVSYNTDECNKKCQLNHLCAVMYIEYDSYDACIGSGATVTMRSILTIMMMLLVAVFI